MSNTRYYVVGDRNVWVIRPAIADLAQCATRSEAMALAICAAQELGMRGERAHVCVLDEDGRFRSRWTFNRDHLQHPHAPKRLNVS
jgi:hypothetical protein